MRSHADPVLPFLPSARTPLRWRLPPLLSGALLLAPVACAPSPLAARVTVRVADESNAVLPHANVVVLRTDGVAATGVPDAPGQFLFVGLAPGDYLVSATHPGFAPIARRLGWSGAGDVRLDLRLALASLHDSAEATAPALGDTSLKIPLSAHDTPRSVTILGGARLREQNFRNVNDALAYVPGVSVNSTRGWILLRPRYRMPPNERARLRHGRAGIAAAGATLFGVEEAVFS
jgi:hypothetical protein